MVGSAAQGRDAAGWTVNGEVFHPLCRGGTINLCNGREEHMAARESKRVQEETEAIWLKCTSCQEILFRKEVERRLFVCPKCGTHLRLTVEQRLLLVVDRGSFVEHHATLCSGDPLLFTDRRPYVTRLTEARDRTAREEAVVCGVATIEGCRVALGLFDFAVFGVLLCWIPARQVPFYLAKQSFWPVPFHIQFKLNFLTLRQVIRFREHF